MVRAEEEKEGPWHSTHRMEMTKRTLWLVDRARQAFSFRVHFAKLGNGNSAQIPFRVRAPRAPRSPIRIPSLYTVHPLLLNPRGISTLSSIRKVFSIPFSRACERTGIPGRDREIYCRGRIFVHEPGNSAKMGIGGRTQGKRD